MFKLYLEFKENSFLQYIVESIFKQLFKSVKTDDYEKGLGLKTPFEYRVRVLKETQLLEKISVESVQNSKFSYQSSRQQRHCHIAFNTVIANLITESIKQSFTTQEYEDYKKFILENQEFLAYTSGVLYETNNLNTQSLVQRNVNPPHESSSSDSEDNPKDKDDKDD